ncbi:hypothetical protein GQ42DRAFT_162847 [Ramicandelaber brevisporus]|nr:hypothetical protein GQ42DRAFT_162847 [Ramicandelaber brevisporus]
MLAKRARLDDSANSGFFRLLDLPLELLEHTASLSTRTAAARALTTNRLVHNALSRAVWSQVSASQIELTQWRRKDKISLIALQNYGHLVRKLTVDTCDKDLSKLAILMPNVLCVYINHYVISVAFAPGRLDSLRNLRVITVDMCSVDTDTVNLVCNWVNNNNNNSNSNKVCDRIKTVKLDVAYSNKWRDGLHDLYSSISNKRRIRFNLSGSDNTLPPPAQLVNMAGSIVALRIKSTNPSLACATNYVHELIGITDATFPLVTKLELALCCAGPVFKQIQLGSVFAVFPAVRDLRLELEDLRCTALNGRPIAHLLPQPWLTVAQLDICGHVTTEDHAFCTSAFPNITKLFYRSAAEAYDLTKFMPKFKQLQGLVLIASGTANWQQPSDILLPSTADMNRLHYMRLVRVTFTANIMQTALRACPNLRTIELYMCDLNINYAELEDSRHSSGVQRMVIIGLEQAPVEDWHQMIRCFKNLQSLHVDDVCAPRAELASFVTAFPNIHVII